MKSVPLSTPSRVKFLRGLLIVSALALIAGAGTIPFFFESPSIYYKFGWSKILLRGGKVLGITAAMLVFIQVLLISRFRFIDQVFSLNLTCQVHRINGVVLAVIASLHPLFVLAAEDFTFYPLEKRYWPEFTGIGLLLMLLMHVLISKYRSRAGLAYHDWLRLHRLVAPAVTAAMSVHILFVSDAFGGGFPRWLVLTAAGLNLLLFGRILQRRFFTRRPVFFVSDLAKTGQDAAAINIQPRGYPLPPYLPGQFAFISPVSARIPKEEHPFSISSTPTRPESWQFVVRTLGDWTAKLSLLEPGDPVYIDGPYGRFSHLTLPDTEPILMIAGGIGITPMLSMLRYMADTNDPRQVLLIWSNQSPARRVLPDTIAALQKRMPQLKVIDVMTRSAAASEDIRRLAPDTLEKILAGFSRKAHVFVCGPPAMITAMIRILKRTGFSGTRVYKETFQL